MADKININFLVYTIRDTGNGDGIVLSKTSGKPIWTSHLGNFKTVEDAKRAAILYFMIERPDQFATNIFFRTFGSACYMEFFTLKVVLEKEGIPMPEEVGATDDGNMLIALNGKAVIGLKADMNEITN